MTDQTQIAAIYFPSWHDDARRSARHGAGFTEWELIKAGKPRFDGHRQPLVPVLGYRDESAPAAMRQSCDLARNAGIDAFVWDWYWYDGEDFLNRPLNETFMNLPDPGVKFALMWANHDWVDVFPATVGKEPEFIWKGAIDHAEFVRMTDIVIERYFRHPQYWRVNDRAWFTVFRVNELVKGLGGLENTRGALADFRNRARAAGVGELHLNAMEGYAEFSPEQLAGLGLDSLGDYGWCQQWASPYPTDLVVDYAQWRANGEQRWHDERARQIVQVLPTVAMGWDSSTRVRQEDTIELSVWPYWPVVVNNTPESFGEAVGDAIAFTQESDGDHVVVINAWNEWTEGSYLEPEARTGDAHLRALAAAVWAAQAPGGADSSATGHQQHVK